MEILIVLGFNTTLTAKVLSWRLVTRMCFLAFQNSPQISFHHRLLFSYASAEVRGENTPERKFASTGYQIHNHQVMSPTRSLLSHPGGRKSFVKCVDSIVRKGENAGFQHFLLFQLCFLCISDQFLCFQQ